MDNTVIQFKDKRAVNEKHPLYETWKYIIKTHTAKSMVCERWLDFWNFVEDVKDKPAESYFNRHYANKPYGPGNWRWKPLVRTAEERRKRAVYAVKFRADKKKKNPDYHKDFDLRKAYGITIAQYREMLAAQNGVCAICEGTEKSTAPSDGSIRNLNVDHCHTTGRIRGLLCSRCNRGLGFFGDSVSAFKRAIKYLGGNLT